MKNATSIDAGTLRAYLLGDLPAEDMDEIERAYFASEHALDEVSTAEQEMIEEYLDGSPSWASRFEDRYLATPAHRRRVEVVRDLRRRARPARGALVYAPFAIAAALLIAVALGVVMLRGGQRAGGRLIGTGAAVSGPAATVAITLPAVSPRGEGETPTVRLRAADASVTLRLERPATDAAPPYVVSVKTVEGREVWTGEASAATDAGVLASVQIPASSLPADDYIVTLSRETDSEVQRYYFRLIRD